jgi:hypothetical protein
MTKMGSFEAVGWEGAVLGPSVYLPLIGVLQFLVLLFLSAAGPWSLSVYEQLSVPSFVVLLCSFLILGILGWRRSRPSAVETYKVSFKDERDEGRQLELCYENAKGVRRESAIVKSVAPTPFGLQQGRFGRVVHTRPVPYASAAFTIRFKNLRGGLALGFDSLEEMSAIYSKLKGPGDPELRGRDTGW